MVAPAEHLVQLAAVKIPLRVKRKIFLDRRVSEKEDFFLILFEKLYDDVAMKSKITMFDIFKNPRYRGRHVILAAGRVYTAKTGEVAAKILKKLERTHPRAIPEVAYLPKARSLIL